MALAWLMDKGSVFVFAFLLCLLSAPIVSHSGGQTIPLLPWCSSLPASAAFWLGGELQQWAVRASTESGGAAGKAIPFRSS